jgi:hypothetical protein
MRNSKILNVDETLHDHVQEPPLKPATFRNFSIGIGISIMGGVGEISFSENGNELVGSIFASSAFPQVGISPLK